VCLLLCALPVTTTTVTTTTTTNNNNNNDYHTMHLGSRWPQQWRFSTVSTMRTFCVAGSFFFLLSLLHLNLSRVLPSNCHWKTTKTFALTFVLITAMSSCWQDGGAELLVRVNYNNRANKHLNARFLNIFQINLHSPRNTHLYALSQYTTQRFDVWIYESLLFRLLLPSQAINHAQEIDGWKLRWMRCRDEGRNDVQITSVSTTSV
jgi:hypothetical protein